MINNTLTPFETRHAKKSPMVQSCHSMPEELMHAIFSHFDVKTLVEKKIVCRNWRQICTEAIDAKRTKAFETNKELTDAVDKYCGYRDCDHPIFCGNPHIRPTQWITWPHYDAVLAEEFASTYGYPMNKWDVSNVEDFSNIFSGYLFFDEDISSWDVSRGTTMEGMFFYCGTFNQNISKWDVSNVTNMKSMFEMCLSFNQNLSLWNVSAVVNMKYIFLNARSFHQCINSWEFWDSKNTW